MAVYRRGGTYHGATGYPMLRLAALVCCGTRTLLDAVFASDRTSEACLVTDLLTAMRPGMIVLADRNFGYTPMITAVAATGAQLLFRVRNNTRLPVLRQLDDNSFLSRMGTIPVRVVRVEITTTTSGGARRERYTLVSTICDPTCPSSVGPARTWWIWAGKQCTWTWATRSATPRSAANVDQEATGKACGVPVARLQGKSWAPSPPTGTVNAGTVPVSPSPPSIQDGGGQAHRRLMVPGRGGGPVVVRGRESRPHGEVAPSNSALDHSRRE